MKIRQFEAVISVVDNNLNISKAAESLGVTQPNISKLITEFEKELGCNIFTRNGRSISEITKEGALILKSLIVIHYHTQQIKQIGQEFTSPKSGKLKIVVDNLIGNKMLSDVLTQFTQQFPNVDCQISFHNHDNIDDDLLLRHDLFLFSKRPKPIKMMTLLPILEWNYVCLVHKDNTHFHNMHFLALNRLLRENHRVIAVNLPSDLSQQYTDVRQQEEFPLVAKLHCDNMAFALTYVQKNLGIAIVPDFCVNPATLNADIDVLDAYVVFKKNCAYIGMRRDVILRNYVYKFIELFNANLDKNAINRINKASEARELKELYRNLEIPLFNAK